MSGVRRKESQFAVPASNQNMILILFGVAILFLMGTHKVLHLVPIPVADFLLICYFQFDAIKIFRFAEKYFYGRYRSLLPAIRRFSLVSKWCKVYLYIYYNISIPSSFLYCRPRITSISFVFPFFAFSSLSSLFLTLLSFLLFPFFFSLVPSNQFFLRCSDSD